MIFINFEKMFTDGDFGKSSELAELQGPIREKYIQHCKRKKVVYESVFGMSIVFQNILSLASENKPGELAVYRSVDKRWRKNTDSLLNRKWGELKEGLPNELAYIKTAIENVDTHNSNSLALEKSKKLSENIFPAFMKTKLKDVPITIAGCRTLRKEIQDGTLKTIWTNRIRRIFESYIKDFGRLVQRFGILPQFQTESIPASDASAEVIRTFLTQQQTLNVVEKVSGPLDLSDLGLTIIPAELRLFTNLRDLKLGYNRIVKIENLESLQRLVSLNLNRNRIVKIENLESLQRLVTLTLTHNQIGKIENLDKLQELEVLQLYGNLITKIENLDTLQELNYLDLSNNQISEIENLKNLRHMKILELSNNQITEIKNLDNQGNLEYLSLIGNQITEIKNLLNQVRLLVLKLDGNKITEIKNLDNQQNLEYLGLVGNQITEIKNLGNQQKLIELNLNNNPIGGAGIEERNNLQSSENYNGFPLIRQVEQVNRKRKHNSNNN